MVPVFVDLIERYGSVDTLRTVSESDVEGLIAPLGLRWRVPHIAALLRTIAASRGVLPTTKRELEDLPGVGDYIAAATLSLHMGRRAVIIDSNVVRLLARLLGCRYDGETRRQGWLRSFADTLTPPRAFRDYNYALLDLSMTICLPKQPLCDHCPIRRYCGTGGGYRWPR